jgi:lipid-A-disaccharide synthase
MRTHFHLLISSGEVSGDLQGGLLIEALHREAAVRGWALTITALGGARMAAAGSTLLANTSQIGAIGLLESLPYVRSTLAIHRKIRAYLKSALPDLTVLIDYPGANVPLAGYLKQTYPHSPVIYYIAPQEWAWAFNQGTTQKILERTDQIVSIFPQEAAYYAARGAKVTWVGHPFVDTLAQGLNRAEARRLLGIAPEQRAIALLPASRQQELQHILPILCAAAQQIQRTAAARYWIPIAQERFRLPILAAVAQHGLDATLTEDAQLTLSAADLVIGKSGTVNLEAALLNVPQIVVYRVHPFSGWLYRRLLGFKVPFISPVNLIAQRKIVPELLQEAATPDAIAHHAMELLDASRRDRMRADYQRYLNLGEPGVLQRAAAVILDALPTRSPEMAQSDSRQTE